jgi:hypothetical protein
LPQRTVLEINKNKNKNKMTAQTQTQTQRRDANTRAATAMNDNEQNQEQPINDERTMFKQTLTTNALFDLKIETERNREEFLRERNRKDLESLRGIIHEELDKDQWQFVKPRTSY